MSCFPMFVELKNRPCLVVGGGQVALRKIKVFTDFGAQVQVVAREILPEIFEMENVVCKHRCFEEKDLNGQQFVVVATDDMELNHRVSMACKKEKIPVNVVDRPSECSFIFPAYLKEGEVVAAFSSGGQSPVVTQYLKEQIRPVMTNLLGELAACLGNLRESVQQCPETRAAGKKIYREILQLSLEKDRVPSQDEIERIIRKYREREIEWNGQED